MTAEFKDYLVAIACEEPAEQPFPAPFLNKLEDPLGFFLTVMRQLATDPATHPTRHGLDRMLDTMFKHPDMDAVLSDIPTTILLYEASVAVENQRAQTFFAPFWTHIVVPAMEQLADVQHAIQKSSKTTNTK